MEWFASLTLERTIRTRTGWYLGWTDGRVTRIDVAELEVAPGGEKLVHKVIRWAA